MWPWKRRPSISPEVERIVGDVLRIAEMQTAAAVSMAKSVEQLAKLYDTSSPPEVRQMEDLYQIEELSLFTPKESDDE